MAAVLLALPAIPAEAPTKDPFSKSEKTNKARDTAARQRPLIYNSDGAHIFQGEKIRGDGFQYNRATDFRDRPLSLAELLAQSSCRSSTSGPPRSSLCRRGRR
jgi:hypothetical protein